MVNSLLLRYFIVSTPHWPNILLLLAGSLSFCLTFMSVVKFILHLGWVTAWKINLCSGDCLFTSVTQAIIMLFVWYCKWKALHRDLFRLLHLFLPNMPQLVSLKRYIWKPHAPSPEGLCIPFITLSSHSIHKALSVKTDVIGARSPGPVESWDTKDAVACFRNAS